MLLVLSCSCHCTIYWSQALSREWRCSWISNDRWWSNYIWVINKFIQYFARNWPWYSLRGLHIRITWFSLYGIHIPLFSLYGIHMPLLPYMVIQPFVLGMALLWAAMDSSLSQGPLLWRHNDMTVIVSRNMRGRERDTQQRIDKRMHGDYRPSIDRFFVGFNVVCYTFLQNNLIYIEGRNCRLSTVPGLNRVRVRKLYFKSVQ